jgi:hypothetical protein
LDMYSQLLAAFQRTRPALDPKNRVATAKSNIALLFKGLGRHEESLAWNKEVLRLYRLTLPGMY